MATATSDAHVSQHVPAATAIRMFPVLSYQKLYKLGMERKIDVKLIPGKTPRYSVQDLGRLVDSGELDA